MPVIVEANRQHGTQERNEAFAQFGRPTAIFAPGVANRIAGVILGLLFISLGLGL